MISNQRFAAFDKVGHRFWHGIPDLQPSIGARLLGQIVASVFPLYVVGLQVAPVVCFSHCLTAIGIVINTKNKRFGDTTR